MTRLDLRHDLFVRACVHITAVRRLLGAVARGVVVVASVIGPVAYGGMGCITVGVGAPLATEREHPIAPRLVRVRVKVRIRVRIRVRVEVRVRVRVGVSARSPHAWKPSLMPRPPERTHVWLQPAGMSAAVALTPAPKVCWSLAMCCALGVERGAKIVMGSRSSAGSYTTRGTPPCHTHRVACWVRRVACRPGITGRVLLRLQACLATVTRVLGYGDRRVNGTWCDAA